MAQLFYAYTTFCISCFFFLFISHNEGRIPSSSTIFTSDEYRQWLSRTPSTSAIYEQIRASRDVLNQQRAARFTYSAENIHAALKDVSVISFRMIIIRCKSLYLIYSRRVVIIVLMEDQEQRQL